MTAYSAADIARHTQRARDRGVRLKTNGAPLTYYATSGSTPGRLYRVTVGADLASAECECPATTACSHGAPAILAARQAAMKSAARTLRRGQLMARELAAVAA